MIATASLAFLARVTHSSVASELDNFEPWPSSALVNAPEQTGINGLSEVSTTRQNGQRLAAWFAPGRDGAVVILAHGTSADRTSLLAEARILTDAGFGILAFDWPGYGGSPGSIDWGPNERDALESWIEWLVSVQHINPLRLGAFGLSMGGYILAQVAGMDERLAAVVLAATPPDIVEQTRYEHRKWGVLSEWPATLTLALSGMPLNEPTPLQAVAHVAPRRVLVLGGDKDPIISTDMLHQLYDAANDPKSLLIIPGGGHGGYLRVAELAYRQQLVGFFECGLRGVCGSARTAGLHDVPEDQGTARERKVEQ